MRVFMPRVRQRLARASYVWDDSTPRPGRRARRVAAAEAVAAGRAPAPQTRPGGASRPAGPAPAAAPLGGPEESDAGDGGAGAGVEREGGTWGDVEGPGDGPGDGPGWSMGAGGLDVELVMAWNDDELDG